MNAPVHPTEPASTASDHINNGLTESLEKEPAIASRLPDALVVYFFEFLKEIPAVYQALAAELWLRRWLYAGERPRSIEQAIESAITKGLTGFSEAFYGRFKTELSPLRLNDDGRILPDAGLLNPEETRIWGLLKARVQSFVEADGLIALIPPGAQDHDGVAVAFRFIAGESGACLDAKGSELSTWSEVLEELGTLGPSAGSQSVRIEAVFPPSAPPGGASLGLPVALAWHRRQAQDFQLFPPLAMLATGEVAGERITAVRGTGGESQTDAQGGAKGQLARRLGVKLFAGIDIASNVNFDGIRLCKFTSGTTWQDVKSGCVQVLTKLKLNDDLRHLNRIKAEDGEPNTGEEIAPSELWARWRRLGRLMEHQKQSGNISELGQIEAWRRKIAYDLGFKTLAPGYCNFSVVESRHPDGELPGRRRELEKFDQFLNSSGGVLLVTGPVGHGKSALVTTWRRKVEARRTHSVFHHYFDQSVERLQSAAIFYRRLLEHLLLEAEEQPPDKEQPSEQDVLVAWDRWKVANSKRQLVVVIDGLDETTSFALPLSNNLPKDVWFMVSCRSGEGSSLHPFAAALKKGAEDSGIRCQQFEVPPLDIPSLESWLRKSLSALDESLKANLPRMEDLAALVRDRSEGNALWVHFFIPDFCQALIDREQWQDVLKPERTPKGVTNLLLIQWQRLNDAAWTNPLMKLTLEILAYLIAARGSLTNQELLTLMGESPLRNLPNLPPEARRWVDVSSSDDKWGARFSLNHWLIRTAIAPKDSAFRREIDKRYAFCLLTYCRQHWSDGSPYALRHLPEELVKHRIWPELDTLVTNPEFQRRQREVFFDEPALALAAVRCALECEVASEPPDLQALTELSLTQASLVYQLAKPISQEDAANMSVLELAEHMTRLPVQWDPAARVMWHFLAAWLSHKERRTAERNTHLNALATIRDVQLPAAWGLLAGVILVETVSPFNPLLSLLAERFLSPEAKAEMLGRLTRRGNTGVRAARQWLRFCDYDEDTKFRSHVVSSLANVGRWKEADWEARAAVTIKGQAVLILQLAELAKDDLDCTERLGEWVEYLEAYVENADLSTGDFLRINTILGRIAAIRVRHHLLRGHNNAQSLVRQAEAFVRSDQFARGSGQFDVQVALALAYGAAAKNRESKEAQLQLKAQAQQHRRKAFCAWLRLRQRTSASTLEIFQLWLWFADLTLQLVDQGVLPIKVGRGWESRLRRALLPESRDEDSRIFRLLNTGSESVSTVESRNGLKRSEPRYMEPVEWNHAIVAAVEAMVEADGFTDVQVLEVVSRGTAPIERARCLARWIKKLVETDRAGDAEPAMRQAMDEGDLEWEDVAAAHSLLARRLLYSENFIASAHHAAACIQCGTDRLRGPKSNQRVEVLTALSCAAGELGAGLFDQAVQLVRARPNASIDEKTFAYLHLAGVAHLRKESAASNDWFEAVLKLQHFSGKSYLGRNKSVTVLCQYARRLFSLQLNERDRKLALATARRAAQGERSLYRRCGLLCEVAEAFALCCDSQSASEIFADIQAELPVKVTNGAFPPGFLWRKRGVKGRLLRGHCLAELVLGLGKTAILQHDLHRQEIQHEPHQPCLPWSEWTEARSFSPRQRASLRYVFDELRGGRLAKALKLAAQISSNYNGTIGLRTAACRELTSQLPWLEWMESRSFNANQRETLSKIFDYLCDGAPTSALEYTSRISVDSSAGTGLRMAVCRHLAGYLEWSDWALAYAFDQDLQKHNEALRGLALAAAVQERWVETWRFVSEITDPSVSASTIRDLAEFSARVGKVDDVLKRAKNLMSSREKDRVLHRIGGALVQRYRKAESPSEKTEIRRALIYLFPSCAEFYGATYLTLARLVEIEPTCWNTVAAALQRRGLIRAG